MPLLLLPNLLSWQRAKKQREEVGVELYGFQQNLAKLQLSLEKAQGNYQSLSSSRVQVSSMQHQAGAPMCASSGCIAVHPTRCMSPAKALICTLKALCDTQDCTVRMYSSISDCQGATRLSIYP